jgi:NADH:ubiquinone oxidoreductase subunit E
MSTMLNTDPATAQARAVLLAQLNNAQHQYGYISKEFMTETARSLQIPISEVYGVTTFYSFLSTQPLGKTVIRICKSIPCYLKHAEMIIDSVSHVIGIRPGETTPDGKYSFELTNCIGACDMAPAMLLNREVHGHLTPEKIAEIITACR